jgi:hypothetical protein
MRALTVVFAVTLPAVAFAQAPQFRWTAGQVLTYRVAQATSATEQTAEQTQTTATRLELVKHWKVVAVDSAGVATLSMSLSRLRMETKTPGGETLLFDSADPAKSSPTLRDEMAKFVNVPLTVVRLDPRGRLVEVKESKFGPASRLESDLPFKVVLPEVALTAAQAWERKFQIKLEPPQGTGETYDAVQKLSVKTATGSGVVIAITTSVANPPDAPADQIPLVPLQPVGEAVFDPAKGLFRGVKLQIQKELPGYQGDGSKYTFTSTYVEELLER